MLSVEELLHTAVEAYQTEVEALKEEGAPGNHGDNEASTGSVVRVEEEVEGSRTDLDSASLLPQVHQSL